MEFLYAVDNIGRGRIDINELVTTNVEARFQNMERKMAERFVAYPMNRKIWKRVRQEQSRCMRNHNVDLGGRQILWLFINWVTNAAENKDTSVVDNDPEESDQIGDNEHRRIITDLKALEWKGDSDGQLQKWLDDWDDATDFTVPKDTVTRALWVAEMDTVSYTHLTLPTKRIV